MKKIILVSIIFLFLGLGLAPLALAAPEPPPARSPAESGFVPLAPISGLTSVDDPDSAANSKNLADFFNNLYKYLIGLAAILAIVEIIWGGLEYSTQESPGGKSGGKERIQQAIYGLVLVLSPVLVFSIINPSILNLSIGLKPLDLTAPAITTPAPTRTTTSSGSIMDLYPCTNAGDCTQAKLGCSNAGGFVGQDYCVDPNNKNKIVSNGKLYFGSVRSGNGCDSGLVPAMKCTPK